MGKVPLKLPRTLPVCRLTRWAVQSSEPVHAVEESCLMSIDVRPAFKHQELVGLSSFRVVQINQDACKSGLAIHVSSVRTFLTQLYLLNFWKLVYKQFVKSISSVLWS